MRVLIRRTRRELIGLLAMLALLLCVNVLPVLAVTEQSQQPEPTEEPAKLVIHMDGILINTSEVIKVTPETEYMFDVLHFIDKDTKEAIPVEYVMSTEDMTYKIKSTVSPDGLFIPSKEDAGKTITITFHPKKLKGEISVKVYVNYVVEKITLNKKSLSLTMKDTYELTATINPENAVNNKGITWSSTDSKIAKVDKKGVVTAIKPGKCYIKATLKDGSVYGQCKVEVKKPAMSSTSKSIAKGKSFTLKANYLPGTIKWTSSNSKIAKVEKGKVTAKGTGTCTITASNGKYKVTCSVKVTNPSIVNSNGDGVEGITVTKGYDRRLKIKGSSSKVTWKSSNKKIAVVKDGLVTGKGTGTCYVYATVDGKTLKCKVTTKANKFTTTARTSARYFSRNKMHLSTSSVYYQDGKLIYKCYVVNTTKYKVERYNYITISVYAKDKLIAKQTYKNVKLNLKSNRSKAMTFTFAAKNVKCKADLRTSKIKVEYGYEYQYID